MATHKSASADGKNQLHFGIGFSIDQASYNQTLQALKKLQNITQDDITGKAYGSNAMQNQINRIKQSASEVQKIWKQAFNSDLGVLNIQKFNSLLNASGLNLKKLGKDWASTGAVGANALRNLASATLTANMNLKRTDSLVNKIGTTFLNTIKWTFASSVINSFTGSLQQSFGYIKSLDSSLNDIRIVTGKSADEMSKFAVKANDAAKALGKQTTDYTNAALIYYQQGLGEEESNTLAETTLKVSNITGQSASTVSEEITAVMNGYQLGANQVEAAFDSLAAVAATTASDLSEISTGMSKVASTANMLGVPLDSLNAQLATIVSVTRQAPESVGTALKTIYARMNDLKLGGTDEDGIQLGDVSGSLEKMGVHILDEQKNLRDLGTVINEVAASWSNWTDKQKIAMAEIMAGKRQYNNLIALFDNWDMYTKALNTSLNAQGTIAKQNGIYLDSLAAHMNSLKAAQEGVMDSFFDSDTFKGFIDFGTSALGVLEKIIDALGGGGTILGSLAALAGRVFSNQISKEIANAVINLKNYNFNLQQIKSSMEALQNFKEINLTVKDNGTKVITDLKEQVMSFGSLVTAEEHNQANAILQKINALYQEKDAWVQNYNTATDFLGIQEVDFIDADSFLGLDEAELQEKININIAKLDKFKTEYQNIIKEIVRYRNNDKNFNENGFLNIEFSPETIGALSRLKDETRLLQEQFNMSDKQAEEFFEKISNGANISKADLTKLIAIFKQGAEQIGQSTNTLKNSVNFLGDNFEQKIKSAQAQWNNFISSLQITQQVKQIVQLVSTTGQLAMGFQTLTNITGIWANDSISGGQKVLQTITNIGFALPQIIAGLRGLHEVMAGLNLFKVANTASTTVEGVVEAATSKVAEAETVTQQGLNQERAKGVVINTLLTKTQEQLAAQRFLALPGDKQHEIQQVNLNTARLAGLAPVDLTKTKQQSLNVIRKLSVEITDAMTASQKAFNIAMMAAPAIIFAVIAVISAFAKANEEAKKKQLELAQTQLEKSKEVLNQRKEQGKKIEELSTSYDKLYKQYQNHQISLAEMRKSTYDLCKQYDDYNTIVKALAGSYDELAEAMKNAEIKKNEDIINAAIDTQRQVSNVSEKQAAVHNAAHPIISLGKTNGLALNANSSNGTSLWGSFAQELEQIIGEKVVTRNSLFGDTLDISQSVDSVAKHYSEVQSLITKYSELSSGQSWWKVVNEYFSNMEDDIKAYQESQEDIKQASLENIMLTEVTDKSKSSVTDMDSFKKFYYNIIDRAKQFFDTEEQAKDWALKNLLDDTDLRRYGYIEEIENSIGKLSEQTKKYIEGLSEEDLQLIISGEIEVLGQRGPDALKKALETLKQNTTPEDTSLAIKVRADVAKGGELKEDDIKSLTAQTGVETLADSLDSGSVLDRLDRYNEAIDVAKQKTLDFLNTSKQEAKDTIDSNLDEIEKLQAKRKELENVPGTSFETESIDKQIAAYEKLNDKLQQIKDGLTLEQIDDSVFSIIRDEIDAIVTKAETLKSAAEMIGEGFKVAADDVREFASLYPELLEQATYTADGQMILNQQVVQDFVDKKREQITADAESKKAQLNSQIAIYEARVRFDDAKIKALEEYLTTDKSAKETQMDIQKAYGEYTQDVATALGTTQQELASNGLINVEKLGEGVHNVLAGIAKQYEQLNRYIPLALVGKAPSSLSLSGAAKSGVSAEAFAQSNNVSDIRDRKADYDQVFEDYRNIVAQREADIDHLNELRAALSGVESSTASSLAALGRVAAGQAGKASGKSGGGGSSKDPETREYKDFSDKAIKDERDIYLEINRIIENTQRTLEKLEKTTEKLVGSKMVAALQQQNKILAQQAANYQKKADIAREEQDRLAKELSQYGFTFGDNGELNNYNTAYTANASRINAQIQAIQDEVNAAIAAYNTLDAAGQQAQKEQLEALEKSSEARVQALNKEWDTITNGVSKYNEAMDTVYESQKAAAQANEKQYENMVSLFEKKIKVTLDFNDAKREFNKFVKNIVHNFSKETAKGLGVMLETTKADLDTILNPENGDAKTALEALNEANGALERMNASGAERDQVTGFTQAEAAEKANEYAKQLMESLTNGKELIDELYQAWLDGFDRIQEKFDKQVRNFDYISDLLQHDMKLISLVYGDKAYETLDAYHEKQVQNDNQKLEMLMAQTKFNQQAMQDARKRLELQQEGTKQYEQAQRRYEATQDAWMDSVQELNSAIEDSVDHLIEKYNNLWNQTIQKSIQELTGGRDLDNIAEEWQLTKKIDDIYLDDINKGFEIKKLELAFDKANDSLQGNIKAQKALNALRDKELTKLKEKQRITQYDVDRANALLILEQKRIALEEAQNNKSKLRLRRDSQGNYTYQYTADEQEVEDKRADWLEANQNVYNMDRQAYIANNDAILQATTEYYRKMAELQEAYRQGDASALEKMSILREQYSEFITDLTREHTTIRTNLIESAGESARQTYEQDTVYYGEMVDYQLGQLNGKLIPGWNGAIDQISEKVNGDGGFIKTAEKLTEELDEVVDAYWESVNDVIELVEGHFPTIKTESDDIADSTQGIVDKVKDFTKETKDLIIELGKEKTALDDLATAADAYTIALNEGITPAAKAALTQWKDLQTQIEAAMRAAQLARQEAAKPVVSAPTYVGAVSSPGEAAANPNSGGGGGGGGSNGGGPSYTSSEPEPPHTPVVTVSENGWDIGLFIDGVYQQSVGYQDYASQMKIHDTSPGAANSPLQRWKTQAKNQLLDELRNRYRGYGYDTQFNTGGYTGQWANGDKDGRLAMLHQKELVLNADDTKNILSAVDIVRTMRDALNFITSDSSLPNFAKNLASTSSSSQLEQNVHITATFPNVVNSNEIQIALENLTSKASQYINRH